MQTNDDVWSCFPPCGTREERFWTLFPTPWDQTREMLGAVSHPVGPDKRDVGSCFPPCGARQEGCWELFPTLWDQTAELCWELFPTLWDQTREMLGPVSHPVGPDKRDVGSCFPPCRTRQETCWELFPTL
jgi:hypothetical protein